MALPFIDLNTATAEECIKYAADNLGKRIAANALEATARAKLAEMIAEESGGVNPLVAPAATPAGTNAFIDKVLDQMGPPEAEKRIRIKIFEDKFDKQPVPVGVNGIQFLIKRGLEVEVPAAVVNVLNDAVTTTYDPETMEAFHTHTYPFQILG